MEMNLHDGKISKKTGSQIHRTSVFFGRPYHPCDRASNENCYGLIRYFNPKGTNINTIPKKQIYRNKQPDQPEEKEDTWLSSR